MQDWLPTLPRQLAVLASETGPGVPIWLGGAGAQGLVPEELPAICVLVRDSLDFVSRLEMLGA